MPPTTQAKVSKKINRHTGPGRPGWKPTPEDLDTIESLAAKGMPSYYIGGYFGFNFQYWSGEICKRYPEIPEAIERGKSKGTAIVVNKMWEKLKNNEDRWIEYYLNYIAKLNPTKGFVQIQNFHEQHVNNNTQINVNLNDMSENELKTLVTQSMQQLNAKNTDEGEE